MTLRQSDQSTENKGYPVGTIVEVRSFLYDPKSLGVVIEGRTNADNISNVNGKIKEYLFFKEGKKGVILPYVDSAVLTCDIEFHYKIMVGDVQGWRHENYISLASVILE